MSVISNSIANMGLGRIGVGSALKGAWKIAPAALNVAMPVMTYMDSRKQGDSVAKAGAKAGAELLLWQVAAPLMIGKELIGVGSALTEAAIVAGRANKAQVNRQYEANFGGNYQDSGAAGTMRQAGMYNIQQSKGAIQSGLGKEAKSYYRR